ncbi:hypothetical protein LSH36_733g00014 [Paralvinella palmiformis]|uniref:Neuroendocrine protein 7B2 n=1 Tax=Paralvinella palmiformis TaxID=53620 RepID=A0AAD9MT25_9ANNE|nr:hypothetical protein LSH36_733g00014 [Paralvinella palmiformis]
MATWSLVLVACLVMAAFPDAQAYDSALYEDMLFQDLYKRLTQMENSYYPADIRDPEYLSHSSIGDGFQYISGGAGEGKQHLKPEGTVDNLQEVKSDDVLPFYCHPPNPCPKGFKAEDGCQEDIKDDAEVQKEWISKMQAKGLCTCDEEHMFTCPGKELSDGEMSLGGNVGTSDIDDFINSILDDDNEYKNPYTDGEKMERVVAKKSPRIRRSVEEHKKRRRNENPYLQGKRIHVVAKKGIHIN